MRSPLSFNVILLASYERIIHTIVCVPFEFEYFARPDLIAFEPYFDVPDFFRFPFAIDNNLLCCFVKTVFRSLNVLD